jgi:hypothetical protein
MKNLPTATQLLNQVLIQSIKIEGHSLNYDSENEFIWITNPYGLDAGIIYLTEDSCQNFLDKMSAGETYGLIPE